MKKIKMMLLPFILLFVVALVGCNDTSNSSNGSSNKKEPVTTTSIWDGTSIDVSWYSAIESQLTISTAEQFAGLAKLVNEGNNFSGLTITLNTNIDLNNNEWIPIGTYDSKNKGNFSGFFDGNGCTVSNFKITNTELSHLGLFGLNNGTISNLSIKNFTIESNSSIDIISAGGLVGTNAGQIDQCHADGTVKAQSYLICYAGILVGKNEMGRVTDNYANGTVDSTAYSWSYSGGLVGYNNEGAIYTGYATSNVSAHSKSSLSHAGGLVGYNTIGTIGDCFATGNVIATNGDDFFGTYAGGIVGANKNNGTVINCYRYNEQSITGKKIENVGTPATMNDLTSPVLYKDKLHWNENIWALINGELPHFN